MPSLKGKKAKEPEMLSQFTKEEYDAVFSESVDFSFKSINSNANGGGIRISRDTKVNLPHFSLSTLMPTLPFAITDYTSNSGKPAPATVFKHLRIARYGSDEAQLPDAKCVIDSHMENTSQEKAVNCESINVRLSQVLIPTENEHQSYISTTPLPSLFLSKLLTDSVRSHNNSAKELGKRRISTTPMSIGGSNPQNVGGLVRSLQTQLFFDAPKLDPNIRKALSRFYKGLPYTISAEIMKEYFDWRKSHIQKHQTIQSIHRFRSVEENFLRQLGIYAKNQFDRAASFQINHASSLPANLFCSEELSLNQQGIFYVEKRDRLWRKSMAIELSNRIANFKFDGSQTLGFSESAITANATFLETTLG